MLSSEVLPEREIERERKEKQASWKEDCKQEIMKI